MHIEVATTIFVGLQLLKSLMANLPPHFERISERFVNAMDFMISCRYIRGPNLYVLLKVWEGGFFQVNPNTTKMKVLGAKMYIHKI